MGSLNIIPKFGTNLKRLMKDYLNKPGKQSLLGLIATLYSVPMTHKFIRTYYDGSVWVHKHRDGVIVDRKINYQDSLTKYKAWTKDIYEFVYKPKPGDVIFDIGAGIGTETYYFSKIVGSNGKIVSVEAQPSTYLCLNKFCKFNKLDNVILLNLAISGDKSEVFIDNNDMHISSKIINTKNGIKVEGTTLDLLMKRLDISIIDFMKMNIEGAEKMAIRGMSKSIKNTKYVCISCHDFIADRDGIENMRTKRIVQDFLVKNNFKIVNRDADSRTWVRDQLNGINQNFLG